VRTGPSPERSKSRQRCREGGFFYSLREQPCSDGDRAFTARQFLAVCVCAAALHPGSKFDAAAPPFSLAARTHSRAGRQTGFL